MNQSVFTRKEISSYSWYFPIRKRGNQPQNNSMYTSFVIALTCVNKLASTEHLVGGRINIQETHLKIPFVKPKF